MPKCKERWREIRGFPLYEVSDQGRIRNRRTEVIRKPTLVSRNGRPLRLQIKLQQGSSRVTCRVHTLVLVAFRGRGGDGLEGRHLDGNPQNNSWRNLVWGTHKENMDDRSKHGTVSRLFGSRHGRAKLTEGEAERIRDLRRFGCTSSETRKWLQLKVGKTTINNIARGETWPHVANA